MGHDRRSRPSAVGRTFCHDRVGSTWDLLAVISCRCRVRSTCGLDWRRVHRSGCPDRLQGPFPPIFAQSRTRMKCFKIITNFSPRMCTRGLVYFFLSCLLQEQAMNAAASTAAPHLHKCPGELSYEVVPQLCHACVHSASFRQAHHGTSLELRLNCTLLVSSELARGT